MINLNKLYALNGQNKIKQITKQKTWPRNGVN